MQKTASILPVSKVHTLIGDAKNAEMCRNLVESSRILSEVWTDFESYPDFSGYDVLIRAELLRLGGVFISLYGKSRNLKKYQIRAKDMLTESISLFDQAGHSDKCSEAKVMLSFCYWNQGEIEESKAIIEMVEAEFGETPHHPVYLQIQINKLLNLYYENKNTESLQIISKLSGMMELCVDQKLKAMFHNQAGICFDLDNRFEESIYHYHEAVRHATKIGNQLFVALNFNNLAMLYKKFSNFNKALEYVDKSIKILMEINAEGFLAHVFDTKSIILQKQGLYESSLSVIQQAIEIFYRGEDSSSLVAALWVKCRNFAFLNKKAECLRTYYELQKIASEKIGRIAVEKYEQLFAAQIFFLNDLSLLEAEKAFRRERVSLALREAHGKSSKAAQILGIDRGLMTDILTKQFSQTTFADDGYIKRNRIVSKKNILKEATNKVTSAKKNGLQERKIAKILFKNIPCTFNFPCKDEIEIYLFYPEQMKLFGINKDSFVAVVPTRHFRDGDFLLVSENDEWIAGKVEFDSDLGLFSINRENNVPVIIDESNIIGKPIAYCPYSESIRIYNFAKLPSLF